MKEGMKVSENFENGQNFPVKVGNEIFWISRAMAVVGFVFKQIDNRIFVLTETRGKGAADNIGRMCVPCGYLDFNETLEEAIVRELKEETGFFADKSKINLLKINSSPDENRQNVSVHFSYFADENEDFDRFKAEGGEPDEIACVHWCLVGTIIKKTFLEKIINIFYKNKKQKIELFNNSFNLDLKWAFNHNKRIIEHISKYYDVQS